MPIARYLECLRHARIYDLLGAAHVSKPRPVKFATLAGSAGGSTRGNCGPSAAWLRAGFGTLIVGVGSEALARIR